jgi:hypothetical protein
MFKRESTELQEGLAHLQMFQCSLIFKPAVEYVDSLGFSEIAQPSQPLKEQW